MIKTFSLDDWLGGKEIIELRNLGKKIRLDG